MPQSPRMLWEYPGENEDPWFDKFVALVRGIDASVFAAREDRNLILTGGGTVAWNGTTLSWSAALEILSPSTGFLNTIAAGSVSLADGQVFRARLTRAPGTNVAMAGAGAASYAENTDNSVVIAVRRGDNVFFRNGVMLTSGSSIEEIGAGQGGGGAGGGDFVWSPGNPDPVGLVYSDFALLHADVIAAGATGRPMRVFIDTTYSTQASIPAGAWNLAGWEISSPFPNTELIWEDGATWTIPNGQLIGVTFRNLQIYRAPGSSTTPITVGTGGFTLFKFFWCDVRGDGAGNKLIDFTGNTGSTIGLFYAYEDSTLGQDTSDSGTNVTIQVHLYDGSRIPNSLAFVGGCDVEAVLADSNGQAVDQISANSFNLTLDEQANQIWYDDNNVSISLLSPANTPAAAIDRDKEWSWGATSVGAALNAPMNEEQVGTTELHVGSVYWAEGHVLKADSQVLMGGALPGETARLRIRRFGSGGLIASFTTTGLLANVPLDGALDVTLVTSDWYGLFLVAGNPGETAILKGVRLNVIPMNLA